VSDDIKSDEVQNIGLYAAGCGAVHAQRMSPRAEDIANSGMRPSRSKSQETDNRSRYGSASTTHSLVACRKQRAKMTLGR